MTEQALDFVTGNFQRKAMIVIDAAGGGDYTDFSDAIDAAIDGDVFFVMPGTYTEASGVTVDNDNVSIIGAGRDLVFLERDFFCTGGCGEPNDGTLYVSGDNVHISDMSIRNIGDGNGTGITKAVRWEGTGGYMESCYVGGNGGRDIMQAGASTIQAEVECYGVIIEQYKTGSNASHSLWVKDGTIAFYHSSILNNGTGGGPQINTIQNVSFYFTRFEANAYLMDVPQCNVLTFEHCQAGTAANITSNGWSSLQIRFSNFSTVNIVGGVSAIGSASLLSNATGTALNAVGDVIFTDINGPNDRIKFDKNTGALQFNDGTDWASVQLSAGSAADRLDVTGGLNISGTLNLTGIPLNTADSNILFYNPTTGAVSYEEQGFTPACPVVFVNGAPVGEIAVAGPVGMVEVEGWLPVVLAAGRPNRIEIHNLEDEVDLINEVRLYRETQDGRVSTFDEVPLDASAFAEATADEAAALAACDQARIRMERHAPPIVVEAAVAEAGTYMLKVVGFYQHKAEPFSPAQKKKWTEIKRQNKKLKMQN